ncbi:MAG: MarR family transcriptional regulator [Chloroflexota bacterium]|nr:MarR family transcriptional regulator [Chloroflexota bacterium]
MGQILQNRIGASRTLPPGEALVLAVTVAAGDLGAMLEDVLSAHGITPRQYNVLRILRGAGVRGVAHGEIGRRLLARAPDVTRLMDQLVARGWAARVRSDADARVVLHRITDRGSEALNAVATPLQERYEVLLARLGARSSQVLVTLCEQVIDAVATDAPHVLHT